MATRLDETPASNISNEAVAQFAIEADRAQREIDEATGRKRAVLKRAKAAGVNTKALIEALRLKRQDPDVVRQEMRDVIRYSGIIAPYVPMTQVDLFEGLDQRPLAPKAEDQLTSWEAEQRGYSAGLNGGGKEDCPWAPGTEHYVRFQDGYVRGQRVIAERMGENAKQADGSLPKRRRSGRDKAAEPDDPRQTDLEEAVVAGAG